MYRVKIIDTGTSRANKILHEFLFKGRDHFYLDELLSRDIRISRRFEDKMRKLIGSLHLKKSYGKDAAEFLIYCLNNCDVGDSRPIRQADPNNFVCTLVAPLEGTLGLRLRMGEKIDVQAFFIDKEKRYKIEIEKI